MNSTLVVVGSASREHIRRALGIAQERFAPGASAVIVPRAYERDFRDLPGLLPYDGVRDIMCLRRSVGRCDVKMVLFTGEGHIGLKILAFLLRARRLFVYTEGGGMFEWCFDQRLAIWNHIRWRVTGGLSPVRWLQALGRVLLYPVLSLLSVMLLLLWYVRLHMWRRLRR